MHRVKDDEGNEKETNSTTTTICYCDMNEQRAIVERIAFIIEQRNMPITLKINIVLLIFPLKTDHQFYVHNKFQFDIDSNDSH